MQKMQKMQPMQPMLDERLKAAADYVRKGASCVDVGTDHGYLAVYLIKNGITDKVIACDINKKPLEAAKKTVEENNLFGKIKLTLSNGLENIDSRDAEDILICGMGGELIMSIILASDYTKNSDKRFILQPMTNVSYLRRELYKNGFAILEETPVIDKNHVYTIMYVCYSGEIVEASPLFCVVGKIPNSNAQAARGYLMHQHKRIKKIADGLAKSADKLKEAKLQHELTEEIEAILSEREKPQW